MPTEPRGILLRAAPRFRRRLAALLLAALTLVACGGSSGPTAAPQPTPGRSARAAVAPTLTVAPASPVAARIVPTPDPSIAAPTVGPAIVSASPTPAGQA